MKSKYPNYLQVISTFVLIAAITLGCADQATVSPTLSIPTSVPSTQEPITVNILVDDFKPQPYQGESVYFFNRLEGDRGALNDSILDWGDGQVTATVSSGNEWGGIWMSLNHPIREGLPIDFSAIPPWPTLPAYQSQITGISVQIAGGTPGLTFRLELKDGDDLCWKRELNLDGGEQSISADLPALGNINQLVLVLDHATAGDFVVLKRISLTATISTSDAATDAFVWSYGMLLNNWNPETGLVRDKAKDASGEFDAIQATGSLAAATALAQQLGVISHPDADEIVNKIGEALLLRLPRFHGLWPHWVKTSSTGEFVIVEQTEWSSVDTVIAAIGLLEAQTSLGLDTSGTEQLLKEIDWNDLVTEKGISHGYSYNGNLIPYAWDAFGGESWLVELAYSGSTGQVAPLAYPSPPTANGSGFIDELAWLFVPPPAKQDYWGTDWVSYRTAAVEKQISYYPSNDSTSCFAQLALFGLSAGEVPAPWMVAQNDMYQAYGIGGAFAPANDGSGSGTPVVVPHYSAMAASHRADASVGVWNWLIQNGYFTPLNNVESLTFTNEADCRPENVQWNQLKGSWNLSLQTLGWGRYLSEQQEGKFTLWQSAEVNPFLKSGYGMLTGGAK